MSAEKIYWLHALTPVHAGAGIGSGFIDLPIMREKITGWPVIPGSSVKGVQADAFDARVELAPPAKKADLQKLRDVAFGKADDTDAIENANAGALVFTDARICCLAVRSYYGTFAYVTAPLVLDRLLRDGRLSGVPNIPPIKEFAEVVGNDCLLLKQSQQESEICLGELTLRAKVSSSAKAWGEKIGTILFGETSWKVVFLKRFVVVPDATFDYLCETGCEVNARIKIERDRKVVANGQFWYEESLPAESILTGLVWCDRVFRKGPNEEPEVILKDVCGVEQILQIGGKATVGKGRVRCVFSGDEDAE